MMIATVLPVFRKKDDVLAGTRVIPLLIEKKRWSAPKKRPMNPAFLASAAAEKYGLITTGNEIYEGRIVDASAP